ncbi:hypothetical protein AAVH_28101 [Aphelenchoides avenae]|nr:hypothetical protein AAVH_28101 [Aphelenchus avenae]
MAQQQEFGPVPLFHHLQRGHDDLVVRWFGQVEVEDNRGSVGPRSWPVKHGLENGNGRFDGTADYLYSFYIALQITVVEPEWLVGHFHKLLEQSASGALSESTSANGAIKPDASIIAELENHFGILSHKICIPSATLVVASFCVPLRDYNDTIDVSTYLAFGLV